MSSLEASTKRQQQVNERLRHYVRERPKLGLFLHGPVGTGKTHRVVAVAGELSLWGLRINFSTVEDFVTKCQGAFHQDESPEDVREELLDCGVLLLDDLGGERLTEFGHAQVDALVDQVYRNQRPILLVTSNFTLNGLADKRMCKLPRVADRLAELCDPLRLDGVSRRINRNGSGNGCMVFHPTGDHLFPEERETPVSVSSRRSELWSRAAYAHYGGIRPVREEAAYREVRVAS